MKNLVLTPILFILAIVSAMNIYSQGNFHDLNPDLPMISNSYFDINGDGANDLEVINSISGPGIWDNYLNCLHDSVWICVNANISWVDTLLLGAEINNNLDWRNGKFQTFSNFMQIWEGPFREAVNKYIGVRFGPEANYNFGWIRVTLPDFLDYSFNPIAGEPIIAGKDVLMRATNLEPQDIGDEMNAFDLKLDFVAAFDEIPILEYRAIVVKTENSEQFNLIQALNLPADRYLPILPDGSETYSVVYNPDIHDSDGESIQNMVSYSLFVLNKIEMQGVDSSLLSNLSNPIYLRTAVTGSPMVVGTDIADFGDGRDLEISFLKAEDETTISSYGILVTDFFSADSFGLEQTLQVPEDYITLVEPTGNDLTVILNEFSVTVEGEPLTTGSYNAFVMSVANGTNADLNALSLASNLILLTNPNEEMLLAGFTPDYVSHIVFDPPLYCIADESNYNDHIYLDLNFDGNLDVDFEVANYPTPMFEPNDRFTKVFPYSTSNVCLMPLEYQTPVNQKLPYVEVHEYGYHLASNNSSVNGPWNNINEPKYLALRIVEDMDTTMAWIRAKVGYGEIEIFEYACWNYTSNKAINVQNVIVFPNPVNDWLFFYVNNSSGVKSCSIYTLQGKHVENITPSSIPGRIDLTQLPGGIYLFQVTFGDGKLACTKIVKR